MSNLTLDIRTKDYTLGPDDARVTLVEYGDYECPYSRKGYRFAQMLLRHHEGLIRFVFRNFPLRKIHPHAQTCAEAALAAGEQGKFWEMHNLLFDNNRNLSKDKLFQFAEKIGLDVNRFKADLEQENFKKRVTEDFRSGVKSGVEKTPTFFVNGKKYKGELEYRGLESFVEDLNTG